MFEWLWKKKPPPEPPAVDRVWIDLAARDRALVRAAAEGPVLVIAFFEDTLARVRAMFHAAGCEEGPRLTLALASRLSGRGLIGHALYVAERHPLPSENRALLERLAIEAPDVVPVFFSALDEPLMVRMNGDRVGHLMQRLGLEPDEPVEHSMVSSALASAREKVAEKLGAMAGAPASARSMEEWLLVNVGPAPVR